MAYCAAPPTPSEQWHAQRAAAVKTMRLLEILREEMLAAIESKTAFHYFLDLSDLGSAISSCLETILDKGCVHIRLHQGQALIARTQIPSLWILTLNGRKSLIGARVPRYVELLCASTRSCLAGPKKEESCLELLVGRISRAEKAAILNQESQVFDLKKEGLNGAQANSFLAQMGKGPLSIDIASSEGRLCSWWLTGYQAVWGGEVKERSGHVCSQAIGVGILPPQVFAPAESLAQDRQKLADLVVILKNTLAF